MNHEAIRGTVFKWIALVCSGLIVLRLYFVQELIAAFLIFSVLFACMAALALIVFMLDHAAQFALSRTEDFIRTLGRSLTPTQRTVNSSATAGMLTPSPEHGTTTDK